MEGRRERKEGRIDGGKGRRVSGGWMGGREMKGRRDVASQKEGVRRWGRGREGGKARRGVEGREKKGVDEIEGE